MASKKKGKEIFKKVFVILSGLAFVLFSVSAVVNMIMNPQTPGATDNQNSQGDDGAIAQIDREIAGYQSVLENEPENSFALERLVELNLQKGDLQGALSPMEKLVALNPDNEQYQQVLGIIQQGLEEEENPPTELPITPESPPEGE